jgi:hypothetical protein
MKSTDVEIVGTKSHDAMLAEWLAVKPPHDPYARPPGAINSAEYAELHGITVQKARGFLASEASAGRLIATPGRAPKNGSALCFNWYQTAKKK